MAKIITVSPSTVELIKTPEDAAPSASILLGASDEDVNLDPSDPVSVTGDSDVISAVPEGDNRILRKSVPSVEGTDYYLQSDGSITPVSAGSISLIAKGVKNGSYRLQTSAFSPGHCMLGGLSSSFGPNLYTTKITAMCLDSVTGHLYVVGVFDNVGAVSAVNAAVWDGESWSELGGGLAYSTILYGVSAYMEPLPTGGFVLCSSKLTHAGGVPVTSGIITWDGSAWGNLDGGPVGVDSSSPARITVDNEGKIYVIDKVYDGSWSDLAHGTGFYGISISESGRFIAYGGFTTVDAFPANNTAEKLGPVFENSFPVTPVLGNSPADILQAVDGTVYIAASPRYASVSHKLKYWDGSTWANVTGFPFIKGYIQRIHQDPVTEIIYVTGQFYQYPGTYYPSGVVYGAAGVWTYVPFNSIVHLIPGSIPGQIYYAFSQRFGYYTWKIYENSEPAT